VTITKAAKKARWRARIKSALYRAARTFTQAFVSTFSIALVTPAVKADTLEKAAIAGAVAGGAAVLALVQRWLDMTSVPTIPPG
jgi:hypothetical protein